MKRNGIRFGENAKTGTMWHGSGMSPGEFGN